MAEESKSWLPNIGILSDSSLIGIPAEMQDQLQREATKRMLIGGLLSGRPDIGFQSAIGTANDYAASQQRLMDLAEKQRQLQEESAWTAKYNPTKYQETSPEFAGPVSPDVSAYQTSIGRARAAGLPTADVNAALRDLTTMRSPRQAAMLAGFQASLPKVGEGGTMTAPGGQYLGTVPQFSPSQGIVYGTQTDSQGRLVPFSQEIPGAIQTRGRIAGTETLARELNTPRQVTGKSGAATFIYPTSPTGAGFGGSGTGQEPPQTANDIALQKGSSEAYQEYSKRVRDAASQAQESIMSNKTMYDIASKIDGNKFTGITSEAASYIRGLPFVGDKYDAYVSDVRMFAKDQSKQTLAGLNSIKQGANVFEGDVVQRGTSDIKDPKLATRMGAAYAIATAEKNIAAREFIDKYDGPAGQAETVWSKSPNNPRIYNHPLVNQTLVEQVIANPSNPQLPAGYKIVPRTGANGITEYGFKKPDGSVTPFATMQNGKVTYQSFGQ